MGKDVRFSLLAEVPEGMTIAEYASALERRANALSGMGGVTLTWTRPFEPGTEPPADAALAELSDDDFREQLRACVLEAARRRFDPDAVHFQMRRAVEPSEPLDHDDARRYREELAAGRDPRD